jgi:CSLREA domain-containing protein
MTRLRIASITIVLATLCSGTAQGADFTVNTTLDAVDADPGDGLCAAAQGKCSLRAAIMESNAHPGSDRVFLGAATDPLTIAGADEDECLTGDLDILDTIKISGEGADVTTIDVNDIDRVIQTIGLSSGADRHAVRSRGHWRRGGHGHDLQRRSDRGGDRKPPTSPGSMSMGTRPTPAQGSPSRSVLES